MSMNQPGIGYSSAIKHKAYIMVPFLILFIVVISGLETMSVNEFRIQREVANAHRLDTFSLVEIETIHRIKIQFKTFKPKDFSFTIGEWTVEVVFIDESADIRYIGYEIVTATLDYDMVFENILDYRINDSSVSDID